MTRPLSPSLSIQLNPYSTEAGHSSKPLETKASGTKVVACKQGGVQALLPRG
jgi:hypothetical protein